MDEAIIGRKKIIIMGSAFAALVLVAIIWVLIDWVSRVGKIDVHVMVAPFAAEVRIDGRKVENNTKIYLAEGEHEVKATMGGFDDLSLGGDVYATIRGQTYILGSMQPNSNEGKKIVEERRQDFMEVEGLIGMRGTEVANSFADRYPIINHLPENNMLFRMGYREDSAGGIVVMIDTFGFQTYEMAALEKISTWGIDPTDYKIEFQNYTNPFGGTNE
jgi:hypothetical protein